MLTTQKFSKQIPKNLAINLLSFISTAVVGIWLTPYLLKHLGLVAYGLVPLAMFLSQYVSVIVNAIHMSINRFLLIALQKKQDKEANEILNTALVILCVFIVVQAMIMGVILVDITQFFTIPKVLITDATWLFGLTFVGFSVSLLRSVFGTSMFAYNRLDILRMIDIVQNVVRVVSIVLLFLYDSPSLKYVGMANVLAALSAFVPTLYYFKRFTPQLQIKRHFFSIPRVGVLSKMSLWILINQVGVLLLNNIDLYLVNRWIDIQATGEYAVVLQFTTIFRTFLTLFAGVLVPVSMIYYSNGEYAKLKQFTVISSKIMVVALVLPLSMLIGFSEEIVTFWLGREYIYLHKLISYGLLFFVVAVPVVPLFNITMAYNKVKLPALIAVGFGLLHVSAIYLFLTYTTLQLWGIISMKLIFEILFSGFILIYVSKILVMSWRTLFGVMIFSILSFLLIILSIEGIKYYIEIETLTQLLWAMMALAMVLFPVMFMLLFSVEEKSLLADKYPIVKKFLR